MSSLALITIAVAVVAWLFVDCARSTIRSRRERRAVARAAARSRTIARKRHLTRDQLCYRGRRVRTTSTAADLDSLPPHLERLVRVALTLSPREAFRV